MEEYLPFRAELIVNRPPLLQAMGLLWLRRDWRGAYRLLSALFDAGQIRPVRWILPSGIPIVAPVMRGCFWDRASLIRYGQADASAMAGLIGQDEYALIDCGADFGQIPLQLLSMGCKITRLIAFEPNPYSLPWCKLNLEAYGTSYGYAVSNFTGKARLTAPAYDDTPQARFIEAAPDGDIEVVKLDDFPLSQENVLIKLDIEGAELPALQGAREMIRSATKLLVCFEAHRAVEKRNHVSALQVMQYLESIRPMAFALPDVALLEINLPRPLSALQVSDELSKSQVPNANILAWSV